jgi:hypothetical protein
LASKQQLELVQRPIDTLSKRKEAAELFFKLGTRSVDNARAKGMITQEPKKLDEEIVENSIPGGKTLSPKTEQQYLAALEAAERIAVGKELESRTVKRVMDTISRGNLTGNVTLKDGGVVPLAQAMKMLTGSEFQSAQDALRVQALTLARNGHDVPKELSEYTKSYQYEIDVEKSAYNRAHESLASKTAKEVTAGIATSAAAATEFTGKAAVNVVGYGAQGVAEDVALLQEAKSGPLSQTSGVNNPLLDNTGRFTGMFNPTAGLPVNQASQEAKAGKTPNEAVADEVDELYAARERMAEINLKPYEEGMKAFAKGDRESMIKAITALDAEENRLLDNFRLVEQTRSIVLSPRYRAAAYLEDDGFASVFSGGGGAMLAERTKKVNDVKRLIAERKHEVDTRKGLLKYKLHKMDAVVPADYSQPGKKIDVIAPKGVGSIQIPDQLKPNGYFKTMLGRPETGE